MFVTTGQSVDLGPDAHNLFLKAAHLIYMAGFLAVRLSRAFDEENCCGRALRNAANPQIDRAELNQHTNCRYYLQL